MNVIAIIGALQEKLAAFHSSMPIKLPDGTIAIKKIEKGPGGFFDDCYMHEFYAGLSDADIEELERMLGRSLTDEMRCFYKCTNGFSMFCGSLSVSGFRKDNRRNQTARLPVSLRYGNVVEKLSGRDNGTAGSGLVFGFYADGEGYAISQDGGCIWLTPRRHALPILCSWPGVEEFLNAEPDRLMLEFSKLGHVDPLHVLPAPAK